MQSIRIGTDPAFRYLLRLGDTCLILGQRIGEWCGHAPSSRKISPCPTWRWT